MEIFQDFAIEAAHSLPNVAIGHKCARLHGHSFQIRITLRGDVDPALGWVEDIGNIIEAFAPLYEQLDHHHLNEVAGLDNPTSENLAIWIWQRLSTALPLLAIVEVRETCTSGCRYEGPAGT